MVSELIGIAFGFFLTITLVAIGSYIGALRALDTFYSGEDSIFLSEDGGPEREG
ncbi:hypothetical protein [Halobacterium wangiae]|uniref:hypothetical protein n=1 Tax=Halobacterium wangiae TaxID=2902623 RepID=UPI001E458F4C|nr:hypothetical protein [Halobacterium wangiae]